MFEKEAEEYYYKTYDTRDLEAEREYYEQRAKEKENVYRFV